MQKLLFQNPIFHEGLNVTVRDGHKWENKYDDEVVEVQLEDTQGKVYGTAKLVGAVSCKFYDVKDTWLQLEHDPDCKTLAGLFKAMQSAYPDFEMNDPVTVLFFVPTLGN